jgi:hypothetical protein
VQFDELPSVQAIELYRNADNASRALAMKLLAQVVTLSRQRMENEHI